MSTSRGPAEGLVLVVEDDSDQAAVLGLWLRNAGYEAELLADADACLAALERTLPEAVCLDLGLPGVGGLEVLRRVREKSSLLPVIILTADRNVHSVVAAMRLGAYDYLPKPIDETKLATTIRNAVERHRMAVRLAQLEREAAGIGWAGIIGNAPPMKVLFREMGRVAPTDVTVLIHGESGSGKELVARGLHDASPRRAGPFVALNCAAIPETLQETELFGHERGAFTNASQRHPGRFEQAHAGTLFLDEVAELTAAAQAKLLRAVQEKSFYRVGGTSEVRSDFRLLAATNRDLREEVRAGRFREDLYFRLAVFELEVPALRARREDVPALAAALLASRKRPDGSSPPAFSAAALEALIRYDWPGNVRELQNALERASVLATGGVIRLEDLPPRLARDGGAAEGPGAPRAPEPTAAAPQAEAEAEPEPPVLDLESLERSAIRAALDRTKGNLALAARQLRIGKTTLYRKVKKFGLKARD